MENAKEVKKPFFWRSAACNGGGERSVKEMETKHLFYTWLMIWNHSAPQELRIWDTKRYVFGPFYTNEYMLEAFREIYIELKTRKDIGPKMKEVVSRIEANYSKTIYEIEYKGEE